MRSLTFDVASEILIYSVWDLVPRPGVELFVGTAGS